jgi:serine/threonine protein kinase/tetratricopeptide (TPR) repeat protein
MNLDDPLHQRAAAIKDEWSRGANPDTRAALDLYPELRGDKSIVLDLAYEEYCLRQERGELPDPELFCDHFPTYRNSLHRLIGAHQFLAGNPHLLDGLAAPSWPGPGERLGDWTLVRELGRGAFARVFLATEASTGDRPVVVKVSLEAGGEAKVLGPLDHPHIVPVLSARQDATTGLTALCMPFRGSATLHDVLDLAFPTPGAAPPARAALILEAARATARAADPEGETGPPHPRLRHGSYVEGVVHLAVQLAEALAYLHARKVYHRDLKPSNVLLSPDGQARLLDFNLSTDPTRAAPHLGGTLPYMAPEQVRAFLEAEAGPADPDWAPSDLFSLGVILYELLTGAQPFGPVPQAQTAAQVGAHLLESQRAGCRPLRSLNPAVGRPLAGLIERCLTFDPAGRPPRAAELAAGLKRYLSRPQRLRRWVARRAGLLCGLGCLLLAGVGAAGWNASHLPSYPERQYRIGVAAFRAGDLAGAAEHFSRGLEADPDHARCRFGRGCARMLLSDRVEDGRVPLAEDAISDFEVLYKSQQEGLIAACLAYCYCRKGAPGGGDHYSKKAAEGGWRSPAMLNNWARSCLEKGKLDDARNLLEEAVGEDLTKAPTAALYNRALLARDQWTRAQKGHRGAFVPGEALEDIREVIRRHVLEGGAPSSTLYADAATLSAMSAVDDRHKIGLALGAAAVEPVAARSETHKAQDVLRYLGLAIEQGYNPGRLARHPYYSLLLGHSPDFERLCMKPRRPESGRTAPQLVLPVSDLPD